jgi:hypothetical protein
MPIAGPNRGVQELFIVKISAAYARRPGSGLTGRNPFVTFVVNKSEIGACGERIMTAQEDGIRPIRQEPAQRTRTRHPPA